MYKLVHEPYDSGKKEGGTVNLPLNWWVSNVPAVYTSS